MKRTIASITAVGGYVPEGILSNEDLSKMVDTSDEWIVSRTGIKERRIIKEPGIGTSDLGARAVLDLMSKKGLDPNDIDLLICATI
ncbi:MAG TPA: 3-oxoacyl-ACP synthase, partial [Saprospiraceae bacterium]|nr:3-oxoacyl-ACP synthase [Saprospiraceae bacterium]